MKRKINRILAVLLLVCLVSAPFASAQYTDSITVLGGLGGISRDALEEMLDLVACKCAGGGGCECGGGGGGACACECTCEICTFLKAHPVGSIYMAVEDIDPQTTYGGEWERWGQGRVPVGVGAATDYNTVGDTSFKPQAYLTPGELGGTQGGTGSASVTLSGVPVTGSVPLIGGGVTLNGGGITSADITSASASGGSVAVNNHTLTIAQIPSHTHPIYRAGDGGGSWDGSGLAGSPRNAWAGNVSSLATGGGEGHNHGTTVTWPGYTHPGHTLSLNAPTFERPTVDTDAMDLTASGTGSATIDDETIQPYVTCYMWKRTAEGTSLCASTGCACGGGPGGAGSCGCEPYTATLPISITDNDISIDLSGYVTTTSLSTTLASYVTSTSLATTLAGYVTTTGLTTALGSYYSKTETDSLLSALANRVATLESKVITLEGKVTALENNAVQDRGIVQQGVDLNEYNVPGTYLWCRGNYGAVDNPNAPLQNSYGVFSVDRGDCFVTQTLTIYEDPVRIFVRVRQQAGVWVPWTQVA